MTRGGGNRYRLRIVRHCPPPAIGPRAMSASQKPLTLDEFLAWERTQPHRYEFDGIQPIAMTGGSVAHARAITRLTAALTTRVKPPCEAFGPALKVLPSGRTRYPDSSIVCQVPGQVLGEDDDTIEPTVVLEVLSPSTALTDRRVKSIEYAGVPGILVYVILEAARPDVTIHRRATAWEAETISGLHAELALPEVGMTIPLTAIYRR